MEKHFMVFASRLLNHPHIVAGSKLFQKLKRSMKGLRGYKDGTAGRTQYHTKNQLSEVL